VTKYTRNIRRFIVTRGEVEEIKKAERKEN
jgi:hypothetical protein